ncbi:hypothetical protein RFY10_14280, partial [Acinetobacter baumannii]|nr:hypothetical protein [Acinetobacter baumannii]
GNLLDISQSDIDKVKDALPGHGIMLYGGRVIGINTEISKYVEMYAYGLAEGDKNRIEAERLNRSIMLG